MRAVMKVNIVQAPKMSMQKPTRHNNGEGRVTDTRTHNPVNYSLEIYPAPHGQIFAETTNIDPIKKWGITLYSRDGLHTLYFLNQRSPGVWSYYSITRVVPATFLARGHKNSYANRAIALYRHYLRLPTIADPPASPLSRIEHAIHFASPSLR